MQDSERITIAEVMATKNVKRLFVGMLFNTIGGGLTLPILVIYLNQVRGLSISQSTLVLSWMALVGLICTPIVGWATDHYGPRQVMLLALLVEATGTALWSRADSFGSALLVGSVVSAGGSFTWPPQTTLLARVGGERFRQKLFGLQFMLLNLGLGLGGLIGAYLVDIDDLATFELLYLLNAASFLVYFFVLLSLRGIGDLPEAHEKLPGGYRDVLRDGRLLAISGVGILLATFGYGSLDAGLPTYLTVFGELTIKDLGPIWAANTATIVVTQWFILRLSERKSRVRLFGLVGIFWSSAWLFIGLAGFAQRDTAFIFAVLSMVIFAIGETVWSPLLSGLVNDIAPEHLRGRYNASTGISWVVAQAAGPAITGLLLGLDLPILWLGITMGGCLVAGGLAQFLYAHLTPAEDGRV